MADGLHQLLGMSDDTTVSYLITLAKRSTSLAKLQQELLSDELLPNAPKTMPFIERLYSEYSIAAAKHSAQTASSSS